MNDNKKGVAIITGATRGIGREIAIQLAKEGYDISFCYLNNDELANELSNQIQILGQNCYFARCNIKEYSEVENFIKDTENSLGKISVLVNNAGIIKDKPLVLMDIEEWQDVIDINLTGTFNFCKCVIFSFIKEKSGSIVNISSYSGIHGNKGQTNYSASKAGIIGFTKSLAKEVGQYGIRVNVIAPGYVETDMTRYIDSNYKMRKRLISSIPIGRLGKSEEVANTVSFLVSPQSSYITGQIIQVDGGLLF